MKFLFFLLSGFLIYIQEVQAQNFNVSGKISDGETGEVIDSARIYIRPQIVFQSEFEPKGTVADENGAFVFDPVPGGEYILTIYRENYKTTYYFISVDDSDLNLDLIMYDVSSSENVKIKDITKIDRVHLSLAGYGYNPGMSSEYKSNFGFEYLVSAKAPLSTFAQIGFDNSFKVFWHNFDDETEITPIVYEKERYLFLGQAIYLYNRLILSKNDKGFVGTFIDSGIGYEFPYLFRYQYKDLAGDRSHIRKIHKYNDFRVMARLGYRLLSLKATYRLTDILKDGYPEPPEFNVGIEYSFGSY